MATILVSPSRVSKGRTEVLQNLAAAKLDRQREAIEKMRKNGVVISPNWARGCDERGHELPALNVRGTTGKDDFVSAPDAVDMSPADIANVGSIEAIELRAVLEGVAQKLGLEVRESDPLAESKWGDGWDDSDVRWTLTPHALRKLQPRKYRQK